jgi:hypothetical protein
LLARRGESPFSRSRLRVQEDALLKEKATRNSNKCSNKYEPDLLLEVWRRFEKEGDGEVGNLTVQELAEKFLLRQEQSAGPRERF